MEDEQQLYHFSHYEVTDYNPHYAWASSIVEGSEIAPKCIHCGSGGYPAGAFDVIIEDGYEYPDFLGCGAHPFRIVSERVISDWRVAGIDCFHTFPVGIAAVRSSHNDEKSALVNVVPPQYYRVEIDGRCQLDLEFMAMKIRERCPVCGSISFDIDYDARKSGLHPGYRVVPGTWDGSFLFRDADLFPYVSLCSKEVVALGLRQQWKNARFEQLGKSGSIFNIPEDLYANRFAYYTKQEDIAQIPEIAQESMDSLLHGIQIEFTAVDFPGEQHIVKNLDDPFYGPDMRSIAREFVHFNPAEPTLDQGSDCIIWMAHLTAPGFQYYLPGFLRLSLLNRDDAALPLNYLLGRLMPLAGDAEWLHLFFDQVRLLNRSQRRIVRQFLVIMHDRFMESSEKEDDSQRYKLALAFWSLE